jgi:FlaA1/EpsC-like NDP-sugar epimerase
MTIPEAVSLVLQAYTVGDHGDVLVLDMGEPVLILDLAKTLIRLSGKSEDEIEIAFTGLRPGEKLYEELFYPKEQQLPTTSHKIKRTQSALISWPMLREHLDDLYSLAANGSEMSIRQKVKEIIPDYRYESEIDPPSGSHARALVAPLSSPNDAELSIGATAGS